MKKSLLEPQKLIDEIEATTKNTIPWVYMDGRYFDDPDEFLEYYKKKYGKKEKK